jgi:SAM-dependent methyltransferase
VYEMQMVPAQSVPHGSRPCPGCSGRAWFGMKTVKDKRGLDGNPLQLVTCEDCGTVFQPVDVTREVLVSHYEYMGHAADNITLTPLIERRLRRTLQKLTRPHQMNAARRPRLLEVGCGGGLFLRVASDLGWEPYATEISSSCIALLEPWLGTRLYTGEFPDAPFEPGSFDLIVMAEVIEHLPAPAAYLRAAHRLLVPGGALFLTTPNYHGASYRLWGDGWRVVADEHLNYFDRQSVKRLVESTGFSNTTIRTSNFDLSMLGSLRRLVRGKVSSSSELRTAELTRSAPSAMRADLRAIVVDRGIELFNHVLNRFDAGDSLKIIAYKPAQPN